MQRSRRLLPHYLEEKLEEMTERQLRKRVGRAQCPIQPMERVYFAGHGQRRPKKTNELQQEAAAEGCAMM